MHYFRAVRTVSPDARLVVLTILDEDISGVNVGLTVRADTKLSI